MTTPTIDTKAAVAEALTTFETEPHEGLIALTDAFKAATRQREKRPQETVDAAVGEIRAACGTIQAVVDGPHKDNFEVNLAYGDLLLRMRHAEYAMPYLMRAYEQDPTSNKALASLSKAQIRNSDPKIKEIALKNAIALCKREGLFKNYCVLGRAHAENNQPQKAIEAFKTALDLNAEGETQNGDTDRIMRDIAEMAEKLGDKETMLSYAEQAYDVNPENKRNIKLYGMALFKNKEHEAAIPILQKVEAIDPYFRGNLFRLSACLTKMDRYEEAMACTDRLEEIGCEEDGLIRERLFIYIHWIPFEDEQVEEQDDDAEHEPSENEDKAYELAERLENEFYDNNPRNRISLANFYYAIGDFENAAEFFEDCLKQSPDDTWIIPKICTSYSQTQNRKEALELIEWALKEYPNNKHVLLAAARNAVYDYEEPVTGREYVDALIKIDPDWDALTALERALADLEVDSDLDADFRFGID